MKNVLLLLSAVIGLGLIGDDRIRGDEKNDRPRTEVSGTLKAGDVDGKLANGVAYETKIGDHKRTVMILSEKPLNLAKLKASFAKNGTDEDFFPFESHVKLLLDDKGNLVQLVVYADGANINRIGDDNIQATVTVKDGMAAGKAGTVKRDKAFGKVFQFETTFKVQLIKP